MEHCTLSPTAYTSFCGVTAISLKVGSVTAVGFSSQLKSNKDEININKKRFIV